MGRSLRGRKGFEVLYDDSIVTSSILTTTTNLGPAILTRGALRLYIIKRENLVGVRVKNTENPCA
jgi:hypothetical protein